MTDYRTKLIEVALPLEAIDAASALDNSTKIIRMSETKVTK